MKKVLLSFLILAITSSIFILSCGKGGGDDPYGNNNNNNNNGGTTSGNSISIDNMAFTSNSLSVKAGTTVKWTNNDNTAHTVTADDASFDSGSIAVGATYSYTFSYAGTIKYHCSIHSGMKGTVVVN
jgi:plastocyanin